jgi:hypothetical protein
MSASPLKADMRELAQICPFRRSFARQVARIRAFENLVHEGAAAPVEIGQARRIGDQAAGNRALVAARCPNR